MSTSVYRQGQAEPGTNSEQPRRLPQPRNAKPWAGLSLLVLLALTVRLGLVLALRSDRLRAQAYEHGEIARNLVEGRGFRVRFLGEEGPTSQQAPVYPLLLAALYGTFGAGNPAAHLAMQVLQCLAGAATVALIVWLSWLLTDRWHGNGSAGRRIGWWAGLGAALYPTHVYAVTHLQVAVLASLLSVLVLALCLEASWRAHRSWAAGAGFAAGLLVLTDPILGLIAAVGTGVVAASKSQSDAETSTLATRAHAEPPRSHLPEREPVNSGTLRKVQLAGIYVFVAACVVFPWLVRNRRVHGEWVFVKSTFGYAFWQGNNARSWGTDKIPKATAQEFLDNRAAGLRHWNEAMWEARHETLYIDDVLLKPTGYRELRAMSEPQKSRYLMGLALADLRRDPGLYARLCWQRFRYFLLFDETNPKARNVVYRVAHLSLLALSVMGLACSWRYRRRLWPTYAAFAGVTVFHTLTITSVRFHLPVEPFQIIWSAVAVDFVLERIAAQLKGLRRRRSAAVAPKLATGRHRPALPV